MGKLARQGGLEAQIKRSAVRRLNSPREGQRMVGRMTGDAWAAPPAGLQPGECLRSWPRTSLPRSSTKAAARHLGTSMSTQRRQSLPG